jgi:hypothetical protein
MRLSAMYGLGTTHVRTPRHILQRRLRRQMITDIPHMYDLRVSNKTIFQDEASSAALSSNKKTPFQRPTAQPLLIALQDYERLILFRIELRSCVGNGGICLLH